MKNKFQTLIIIFFYIYAIISLAANLNHDPDFKSSILISSDKLHANGQKNIAIYSGNVKLKQGRFKLTGNTLEILFSKQKKIKKIILTGNPATFKKFDYKTKKWVHGHAKKIIFTNVNQPVLELVEQASVIRANGESLSGNRINYIVNEKSLKAYGTHNNRVHVLIPAINSEK